MAERQLNFSERVKQIDASLEAHRIGHAFGGAIALVYAVEHPRLTHDIDLNISVEPAKVDTVLRALPDDLTWTDADAEAVRRDGQVRLYWEKDLPVDLFFPQHDFHRIVASRVRIVSFDRQPLPVISPTDLTVFKTLFNRTRDWADIEAMLEAGTVDTAEALRWVARIVGDDHPSYHHLAGIASETGRDAEVSAGDLNVWKGRAP